VAGALNGALTKKLDKTLEKSYKASILEWAGAGALFAGIYMGSRLAFQKLHQTTKKTSS
jgi:hypothetical protein